MLRVFSWSRWNINGSFVRQSLCLPLVLKAKARQSSELVFPDFFQSVVLDSEGSVVISWRWPNAHAGMKIMLTHSELFAAPQSPSQCFWQDRFFFPAFDTFSADSSCSESAFPHTQKDTNDHDWTSTQASRYWSAAVIVRSYGCYTVIPVTDRNVKDFLDSR